MSDVRPRVLFVVDMPGWAHERKSQNLQRQLRDEFDVRLADQYQVTDAEYRSADLVLVYYWPQAQLLVDRGLVEPHSLAIGVCSHFELAGDKREFGLDVINRSARVAFLNSRLLMSEFASSIAAPTFYTPNGVDTGFFRPDEVARPQRPASAPLRVGWAGSLTNHGNKRGYHEFIVPAAAAAGVELETAAREERWRDQAEMLEFYRELDVYVCASITEGTPNPCLEAAACGVPLVTTAVGSMPDFVEHGVNGLFVDRHVEAFERAFRQMAEDPAKRAAMGLQARLSAERWDWSHVCERYRVMLREALGSTPPSRLARSRNLRRPLVATTTSAATNTLTSAPSRPPHFHFWTLQDHGRFGERRTDGSLPSFNNAFGHTFVDLFAGLGQAGCNATVGPRIPRAATVTVVSLAELSVWGERPRYVPGVLFRLSVAAIRNRPIVLIRADRLLALERPDFIGTEVVASRGSIADRRHQTWIPLLPHSGLRSRDASRGGEMRDLCLIALEENLPEFAQDPEFIEALAEVGVQFRVGTQWSADPVWSDFAAFDAALCTRGFDAIDDTELMQRQPPTQLVNAWAAGVIPLIAPEPAYLDLAVPGEDAVVVRSVEEVVTTMADLRENPAVVAHLKQGVARRQSEFSEDAVLAWWAHNLATTTNVPSLPVRLRSIVQWGWRTGRNRHDGRQA